MDINERVQEAILLKKRGLPKLKTRLEVNGGSKPSQTLPVREHGKAIT
jgi:hypothetical protein